MRNIRQGLAMLVRTAGLAAVIALGTPAFVHAQSAIIYGSLSNFDIANDTGKTCHGFEVQLEGLTPAQYGGSFTANRYGDPVVAATPNGTSVTWKTSLSSNGWVTRTLPHTVSWFSGQCYQWSGPSIYEDGGCEHFGTYFNANPVKVTSRWLCESDTDASVLVPIDPPTSTPFASYFVNPPDVPNNPPQLVAEVQAPEPAEVPGQYGEAQWIRTFVRQLDHQVVLNDLVADQPAVVPMDPAQLEADYAILQDEPPSGGSGNRRRNRNSGNIDPTTKSIVRRIETFAFTGQYDPLTHEALCADLLCNAPAPEEIGELLDVQMTAANVQPDALFVVKVGNGNVDGLDRLIACGSKCVQPYSAGTVVTLTAKASSGSAFSGWSGACTGTALTCDVTVNGDVRVTATFAVIPKTGGGGGGGGATGGGGGGTASRFTLSASTVNSGVVTASPSGTRAINCGKDCSSKFDANTTVTLTATPAAGKAFLGWSGACTTTNTTCTIVMSADKSVKANFTK